MPQQAQQNVNSLPWLLESKTPGIRYLALRDLVNLPSNDAELLAACKTAHTTGPIATILAEMHPDGYWAKPGPGYNPKYRSTVWSIILLAQLGASIREDERVGQACAYLLEQSLTSGGQFTMSGAPSGTIDCLQGNLCWALVELGCNDPRLELAFEWMARSVTGDGVAPKENKQASVRYYAYQCGPTFACGANNKLPCAWGATKVMLAFQKWPTRRRSKLIQDAIERGVDFFFSVAPDEATYPSGLTGKPSQNWWKFGFPVFYVTDLLQIVEALVGLGYGDDPRLSRSLQIIREKQDTQGRWTLEYSYTNKTWGNFGVKKEPNPWVTLRALRVLKAAVESKGECND